MWQRLLATEAKRLVSGGTLVWLFPATVGAGWLIFPCLEPEFAISMGFYPDPNAPSIQVQQAKMKRLEAFEAASGSRGGDEDDEEEEEEEEEEEAEAAEEEEESGGDDEEESGGDDEEEGGDDGDGDDDDDEEESKVVIKPLYLPTKGKLNEQDVWDNFTIKAVHYGEDDDDDDDDEDDDDDDE